MVNMASQRQAIQTPNHTVGIVNIRLLICEIPWIHIYSQLKQLKGIQKTEHSKNSKRKLLTQRRLWTIRNENFNITLGSCVPNSLSFITVRKSLPVFVFGCWPGNWKWKWFNANGIYSELLLFFVLRCLALCFCMHLYALVGLWAIDY